MRVEDSMAPCCISGRFVVAILLSCHVDSKVEVCIVEEGRYIARYKGRYEDR